MEIVTLFDTYNVPVLQCLFLTQDTTERITSGSYLDLLLAMGRDGQLYTSIYDKRDDFNIHIKKTFRS